MMAGGGERGRSLSHGRPTAVVSPMPTSTARSQGAEFFERQQWAQAYALLSTADREESLPAEDLERLAMAAYLVGKDADSFDVLARVHNEFLKAGETRRAVRAAFWLGFSLQAVGEHARAGGWIARGQRLLDDCEDCVEHGYLMLPPAVQTMFSGNAAAALEQFIEIAAIGERYRDNDLVTIARMCQGQALIKLGQSAAGVSLFDEVMVAVTTGEVAPPFSGLIYCAVIETCSQIFDLRRAQEWTGALSQWCESHPDMVPYRGQCLVRRAEIMQLRGAWADALAETQRARDTLAQRGERAAGFALYQLGELHRLRGEFADAEESYRQASEWGCSPQPGMARLRLAQGEIDAAKASIKRVLDEAGDEVRPRMLGAFVDIMLEAGDVNAARGAAADLSSLAQTLQSPYLGAVAAQATGAVQLADGNAREALSSLRRASTAWTELAAPYERARASVLIALACRALGDEDTAQLELGLAQRAFESLGAAPDAARAATWREKPAAKASGGLTDREVEVLRLVAAGKTNKAIAEELGISEKTIARHVSNIFMKLGVSTRAAATAYAYKHDLA